MDREKVIKGLEELYRFLFREYANIPAEESKIYYERTCAIRDSIAMLKEQKLPTELKQKMWNALYAEEDEYEKKFVGKEEHLNWFIVYRPWLQKGFDIAINVIAEWEGR